MHYHEIFIDGIQCVRKYRFEGAHGIGNNLHGHNFELYVLLQGQPQEYSGMVVELSSIDDIVNDLIINKFDHQVINFDHCFNTHENISIVFSDILMNNIPFYHGLILSENFNGSYTKIIKKETPLISRTHTIDFSALHLLRNPSFDEENNQRIFGKCSNLHGHDYRLSVTISGIPNPNTGLLIKNNDFENILLNIRRIYDKKRLQELDCLNQIPATTENFIKVIWKEIDTRLGILFSSAGYSLTDLYSKDIKLEQVTLQETDRNVFIYKGE